MAAIHFDSQSVKKQAKLLEEAADQIQNQTVKVITAANEAVAASWSGCSRDLCEIYAGTEYRPGVWCSFFKGDRGSPAGRMFFHGKSRSAGKGSGKQEIGGSVLWQHSR